MTLAEIINRAPLTNVEESLQAIDRRESEVHAWAYLDRESSLARVGAAGDLQGPLRGVPVGVKDIYDTRTMPTAWGSPLYRDRRPETDCAVVQRLEALGAVILGKTHTTGFAYFDPGPTGNPYDPRRTPGGSSSGSAAAVAAGMVPVAVGSQTMGSVLRPASFCGVTGFMPSYGRISLEGVLPLVPSLDHVGFFTRTAEDMALLWEAFDDHPPAEARAEILSGPYAVLAWPPGGQVEPEMAVVLTQTVTRLREQGFDVQEVDAPEAFAPLPEATLTVFAKEAAQVHHDRFEEHGRAIGEKLALLVEQGRTISDDDYEAARRTIAQARQAFEEFAQTYPVTLTPAALGPAPIGLASTGDPAANAPWTALGGPAISIPMSTDGPPLGLQLASAPTTDAALLATAQALEAAL